MTKAQQQFLELLRSGLWGKPADASMFQGEIDWKAIVRMAREQTVHVLIANGVETLPKELWPPKEAIYQLIKYRTTTLQMHALLNSVLAKITTALNAEGIPSVLLKGQGLAQNYLIPESRICGDIDLYVGEENIDRACKVIATLSNQSQDLEAGLTGGEKHKEIKIDGVVVEVHQKAISTYSPRQMRLQSIWTYNNLDLHFQDGTLPSGNFNQVPVNLPSADFNAVFILYHTAHHMIQGGIGLRQVCDWTMFLAKHHSEIEQKELKKTLQRFNMVHVWDEFGRFAVNILGLNPEFLPLAPRNLTYTKETEFILNDILANGNFGHYRQHNETPQKTNIIKRKWDSCIILCKLIKDKVQLFPSFALPYGLVLFIDAIKRLFQGK